MDAEDDVGAARPYLTLQRASLWIAVASFTVALLATGGCSPFPAGDPELGWLLHPLVLAAGAAAGAMASRRGHEIDADRWRYLQEPGITQGERAMVHQEAEAARKRAGVAYLLGPAGIAFALATHFARQERRWVTDTVLVTVLAGFALGLWLGALSRPGTPGPGTPGGPR
jgi:hypothetical protein